MRSIHGARVLKIAARTNSRLQLGIYIPLKLKIFMTLSNPHQVSLTCTWSWSQHTRYPTRHWFSLYVPPLCRMRKKVTWSVRSDEFWVFISHLTRIPVNNQRAYYFAHLTVMEVTNYNSKCFYFAQIPEELSSLTEIRVTFDIAPIWRQFIFITF